MIRVKIARQYGSEVKFIEDTPTKLIPIEDTTDLCTVKKHCKRSGKLLTNLNKTVSSSLINDFGEVSDTVFEYIKDELIENKKANKKKDDTFAEFTLLIPEIKNNYNNPNDEALQELLFSLRSLNELAGAEIRSSLANPNLLEIMKPGSKKFEYKIYVNGAGKFNRSLQFIKEDLLQKYSKHLSKQSQSTGTVQDNIRGGVQLVASSSFFTPVLVRNGESGVDMTIAPVLVDAAVALNSEINI